MLGADVRPVPAVPFDNPQNYNHQAARYAASLPNAVWTNQFDNPANRQAHIDSTGPEIWEQTRETGLDAFVCATGTGGTLAGTTRYLKEKSGGEVKCFLADPPGSVLFRLVEEKVKERKGTGSITEGQSVNLPLNHRVRCPIDASEPSLTIPFSPTPSDFAASRYRTGPSDRQPLP